MIYKAIRDWIMSVALIVVFMTLIDMITPSNNFKKYIKFVTGLIVIITIMAPVFKIFAKNLNPEAYISRYFSAFQEASIKEKETVNIKEDYDNQVIDSYKQNLIQKIESEIVSSTQKKYKVVSIQILSDVKDKSFGQVKYIELKKSDENMIKQVDKIVINDKKNVNYAEERDPKILSLLKNEFGVDPSKVNFTK